MIAQQAILPIQYFIARRHTADVSQATDGGEASLPIQPQRDSLAGVAGINNILSGPGGMESITRSTVGCGQRARALAGMLIILLLTAGSVYQCGPGCSAEVAGRDYVDLYDEAVNLYYKPPFQSERAMQLLEQGCQCNPDHQDLSCYNLGVMREIRGETTAALEAYRKARELKPGPYYNLAIQRLAPGEAELQSAYLQTLRRMVLACRQGQQQSALQAFDSYVTELKQVEQVARPSREAFGQPFLAECLAGERYESLLQELPARPRDAARYYQERARLDEFHTIFDMELYYRKELESTDSNQQITATWQIVMEAGQRGDGQLASVALRELFALLGTAGRKSTEERLKAQALRRAAAVLVDRDLYFARIKDHPQVRAAIRPVLGAP